MTSLIPEFISWFAPIMSTHKHSECTCSRVAPWLSRLQQVAAGQDIIPWSDQHNGLSHLLALIGTGTLTGSHTLESRQSALEAFEQ